MHRDRKMQPSHGPRQIPVQARKPGPQLPINPARTVLQRSPQPDLHRRHLKQGLRQLGPPLLQLGPRRISPLRSPLSPLPLDPLRQRVRRFALPQVSQLPNQNLLRSPSPLLNRNPLRNRNPLLLPNPNLLHNQGPLPNPLRNLSLLRRRSQPPSLLRLRSQLRRKNLLPPSPSLRKMSILSLRVTSSEAIGPPLRVSGWRPISCFVWHNMWHNIRTGFWRDNRVRGVTYEFK